MLHRNAPETIRVGILIKDQFINRSDTAEKLLKLKIEPETSEWSPEIQGGEKYKYFY